MKSIQLKTTKTVDQLRNLFISPEHVENLVSDDEPLWANALFQASPEFDVFGIKDLADAFIDGDLVSVETIGDVQETFDVCFEDGE